MADDDRHVRVGQVAVEAIPQAVGTVVGGLVLLALGALFGLLRGLDRADTTLLVVAAAAALVGLTVEVVTTRAAREAAERAKEERAAKLVAEVHAEALKNMPGVGPIADLLRTLVAQQRDPSESDA